MIKANYLVMKNLVCLFVIIFLSALMRLGVAETGAAPAESRDVALVTAKPAELTQAASQAMMLGAAKAGKRIVAVGDHGIVLLSDDQGANFRQAKVVPVRSTLTAVTFANDRTGWAVGHWGAVIRTTDGGETWKLQRLDVSVDQPLFSVHFKNEKEGFAVGLWSIALTTKDGGETWQQASIPAPTIGGKADRNLFKIFASLKGALFISGEQGGILRSDDGGLSWTYIHTGYKGTFWSGCALKNGTLLVTGLRGTIYRSTDDGHSWLRSESGTSKSITDCVEARVVVRAVGLDGALVESRDSGVSFRPVRNKSGTDYTATLFTDDGQELIFSKQGIVERLR